jgi:protein transport protein SEC13
MDTGSFDTIHEGYIYDAQFDYYGRLLATCSSDNTIKIFQVTADQPPVPLSTIPCKEGSAQRLAWSHPKFGSLLASAGLDKKVTIWKEVAPNNWAEIWTYDKSNGPFTCVAWGPWQLGLVLAASSADGCVSVLTCTVEDTWEATKFLAHDGGATCLSWAPVITPNLLRIEGDSAEPSCKLVTGGADRLVKVWAHSANGYISEELARHTHVIRDVAWAPSVSFARQVIASCAEDGLVVIWTRDDDRSEWHNIDLLKLTGPIWRVSWSVTGSLLAVSASDSVTRVFEERELGLTDQ